MNHFQNFQLFSVNKKVNTMWKGMWIAIEWEIWNYRNKIVFNNAVVDDVEIFTLIQLKTWSLVKFRGPMVYCSFSDWYFCPTVCLANLN